MLRQEAHGLHPSPEKHFHSIKTFAKAMRYYEYNITLIKRKKTLSPF